MLINITVAKKDHGVFGTKNKNGEIIVKISDAVIQIMSKKTTKENWSIVPFDRHELCCEAIELAGLKSKTGDKKYLLNKGRYMDCKRVADALEKDPRFDKLLVNHGTLRRCFRHKKTIE